MEGLQADGNGRLLPREEGNVFIYERTSLKPYIDPCPWCGPWVRALRRARLGTLETCQVLVIVS